MSRDNYFLPTFDELFPLVIFLYETSKYIMGISRWFLGLAKQYHMRLIKFASTLVVVASRAGSNHIFPYMFASQVLRENMIQGKVKNTLSAVLAGIIIPAEDLPAGKLYSWTRAMNHLVEPDHGRSGYQQ